MDKNIYAAPQSEQLSSADSQNKNELASRWLRLGSSLLDSLFLGIITLPIMYFTGYFEYQMQMAVNPENGMSQNLLNNVIVSLGSLVVFFVINGATLFGSGQTLAKKILKIRAVEDNGRKASIGSILKRYAFYMLVPLVPVVGSIIAIVNICFIFGENHKCLHDMVGGTKVVKC